MPSLGRFQFLEEIFPSVWLVISKSKEEFNVVDIQQNNGPKFPYSWSSDTSYLLWDFEAKGDWEASTSTY